MFRTEKISALIEFHKPVIFGLFLSTIIFRHALANVFLGILFLFFFIQIYKSKRINFKKDFLPIFLYFFWGIASLSWTTNFSNTSSGIVSSLPLFIIPILIWQYADFSEEEITKTNRFFSISLLLYFFVCVVNASFLFLDDNQNSHFFYHSLVSVYDNNAIYISLAVAICILIQINLSEKSTKDYMIIVLLYAFLLVLSSKNIIITTMFFTLATIFINKKNLKYVFILSSVICFIFLFLKLTDNPIKERFLDELNINFEHVWNGQDFYNHKFSGLEIRFFQWRLMGEMIHNNQVGFLGLGLHNVNYLLDQYFSYYNLYKGYFNLNYHNQYLQTLGELGYIGLFLLMTAFLRFIHTAIRLRQKIQVFILLLFITAFLTESFLSRQKGIFLIVTVLSIVFKIKKKTINKIETEHNLNKI